MPERQDGTIGFSVLHAFSSITQLFKPSKKYDFDRSLKLAFVLAIILLFVVNCCPLADFEGFMCKTKPY